MSKFSLLVIALIVAVNCIYYADGLKCYVCAYVEGAPSDSVSEKSCKSGKKPDEKLSTECNLKTLMPAALVNESGLHFSNKTVTVGEFMAARGLSTDQQYNWGCTKVVVDGKIAGQDAKITFRGCFGVNGGANEEKACKDATYGEWLGNAQSDIWSAYVAYVTTGLTSSSSVTGCQCTKDNCNSALPSVSMSMSLMLGGVAVAFLKNLF